MAVSMACLGPTLKALATLYGHQNGFLTEERLGIYQRALASIGEELFVAACDVVATREKMFPVPATILEYADQLHAAGRFHQPRESEGDARERARRNAARLAESGLPSEVMTAQARSEGIFPPAHRVGSRQHQTIGRTYGRLVETLERALNERMQQSTAEPGNALLEHGVDVLSDALSRTYRDQAQYADTGTIPEAAG